MRILPVNNFKFEGPSAAAKQGKNLQYFSPVMGYRLNSDTISFKRGNRIADIVEHNIAQDTNRLNNIATVYLDVLESVAAKLKDLGVTFDRSYCEKNPVKSPKSYTSKIMRSGSFKVPDTIRATMYIKDLYDLSILREHLLPELKKRGYSLSQIEMPLNTLKKRGYVPKVNDTNANQVKVPDLDIRLENPGNFFADLESEYRYLLSNPQKSGYEDIQLRLVSSMDNPKKQVQHELLILFGPHYAKAKEFESANVYDHLRKFKELYVKINTEEKNCYSKAIDKYIDCIEKMFRENVSQKLYRNAKNKDLNRNKKDIPITFTEDDIQAFELYFRELNNKVMDYYNKAKVGKTKSQKSALGRKMSGDKKILQDVHDNLLVTMKKFLSPSDEAASELAVKA